MSDGSELSADISAYVFTEHSDYLEYLATDIDLPTEEEQDMTTTHQHQEDRSKIPGEIKLTPEQPATIRGATAALHDLHRAQRHSGSRT